MANIQREAQIVGSALGELLRTYNFFKQQGISHTEIMALLVLTGEYSGDELRWLTSKLV
mgnify:CR=1 FL=1